MALSPSRPGPQAGAQPEPTNGPAVPVLVVTTDDDLWMRLSAALPGLRLEQYDDVGDLAARWNTARPACVLVDARDAAVLAATVERVQTHALTLVPVALVGAASRSVAATLERQGSLYAFVEEPLEPAATLAALERAAEEALARAALVPPGVTPAVAGPPPRTPPSKLPVRAVAGALVAAVVGGGAWLATRDAPPPAPGLASAPTATPAAPAAAPASSATTSPPSDEARLAAAAVEVERHLSLARAAMRDKRYVEPAGGNALNHYRDALAIEPANGEARQGLDRIAELLIGRAEAALAAREYPGALRALETARSLQPDHPRLAALDAQVNARVRDAGLAQIQAALQADALDRASSLLRQAERTASVPAPQLAQLRQELARRETASAGNELVRLAQARLAQGRLLEPANDSARHYLAQLQAQGRPELADAVARLQRDYVRRAGVEARAAIGRGAWPQAESWIGEVRALAGPGAALPLARELAQAQQESTRAVEPPRYAQLAQERLAANRLLAPENDNAVHYYRALQAAEPRDPALPALRDAIGTALVAQARAAYAAARGAEAQAALDAAREFGVPASTLSAVQAAAESPRPAVVTSPPRLLRALSPAYPVRAQQAGTEGWVDVDFVVDAEGEAREIRVAGAQPQGVFDSAALAAVRRARFEPARTADGAPVAMPTRLRVRFDLQD